jgi:hypothetical protein
LRRETTARLLTLTERVRDVILSIESPVGYFAPPPGVGYKLTEAL